MLDATDLPQLVSQRGWPRARLIHEMRGVATALQRRTLPDNATLSRMVRQWNSGQRALGTEYAEIFSAIFGVPFRAGQPPQEPEPSGDTADLEARLSAATRISTELVGVFETQTQSYRDLDRMLGAASVLQQTTAHVGQMTDLWTYAVPGAQREALASAVAEAAALAGWQALDVGDPAKAWLHHEDAKRAARESKSPAILAHVTAQQAYALLELDRTTDAVSVVRYARQEAGQQVPAMLQSWLWAAEAEALAAAGDAAGSQTALDNAEAHLPASDEDGLPFLYLNDAHLARWRGHCHARLGLDEAVDELTAAIDRIDPTFTRAAAGHHCDLAMAYSVRGEHDAARAEAAVAESLAAQTASVRQRRRIKRLLRSGAQPMGH